MTKTTSFRKVMILSFIRDSLISKDWEYYLHDDSINVTFIMGNKEYNTSVMSDDDCWKALDYILNGEV